MSTCVLCSKCTYTHIQMCTHTCMTCTRKHICPTCMHVTYSDVYTHSHTYAHARPWHVYAHTHTFVHMCAGTSNLHMRDMLEIIRQRNKDLLLFVFLWLRRDIRRDIAFHVTLHVTLHVAFVFVIGWEQTARNIWEVGVCVTAITRYYLWHDSFSSCCTTCDMTHSVAAVARYYLWHDCFTCCCRLPQPACVSERQALVFLQSSATTCRHVT